jgi:hypothetical protein
MATFQTEYDTASNTIDSVVTTQLSSVLNWINIPGGLTKASSSASGFVWGYNSGSYVYVCQLPCTGNWTMVDLSSNQVSTILDLTTDGTNVYILYTNTAGALGLLVTPASNQGTRTTIPVPFAAISIFSTHTYIWAQDSSNTKQKCPKPCTMANWQASKDTSVTITSSDDSTLYGKDLNGQAMQTDETLQSEWQPISNVNGSIYGKGADGTLYGIDSKQNAFQYDGTLSPMYTQGLTPTNINVDSNAGHLWMTTATPGDLGNVFTRSQKPDYTTIMNTVNPIDKTRDDIANKVETKFERQTDVMIVNKQVQDVITFFKQMFHIDKNTNKNASNQIGKLDEDIQETQKQLDQINNVKPILIGTILTLLAVLIVYLTLSYVLGSYVHSVALIVIGAGMTITLKTDLLQSL